MYKTLLTILLLMVSVLVNAQQERKYIRKGNREYKKAIIDSTTTDTTRYQKAEVDYRKALEKEPNNWDASYNLANSIYKQGKYEDAVHQYQAVSGMDNDNKENLAKAYHNLGNSYLRNNKLQEAVEAFKNSLRNNPNDYETKYNLAWAQNKLQQQQQQQNQDQNKDQDNKDKQDKEQQNKNDQQNKDKQQEQEQKQQQQKQQQQQQEKQQAQQQQQNQISKEDAMRILEALQNDEKQVQKKVQKQKAQPKKRNTEKDW